MANHTNAFIEALHELIALQHEANFTRPPLDIFNSMHNIVCGEDGKSITIEWDNDEDMYCLTLSITADYSRPYTAQELRDQANVQYQIEACPGCGNMPGDGMNPLCNHGGGCGFWRTEAANLMSRLYDRPQQPHRYQTDDGAWHDVGE